MESRFATPPWPENVVNDLFLPKVSAHHRHILNGGAPIKVHIRRKCSSSHGSGRRPDRIISLLGTRHWKGENSQQAHEKYPHRSVHGPKEPSILFFKTTQPASNVFELLHKRQLSACMKRMNSGGSASNMQARNRSLLNYPDARSLPESEVYLTGLRCMHVGSSCSRSSRQPTGHTTSPACYPRRSSPARRRPRASRSCCMR